MLNENETDPVLKYALENRDYFSWDPDMKKEACYRMAIWVTNMSFNTEMCRQEIIDYYKQEAESEEEYEYIQFMRDVETFFKNKNWNHLNDGQRSN